MNYCVLLPTYNNEQTLKSVLNGILEISTNVIVVNDGSTDSTQNILKEFSEKITLIHYAENQGKGNALKLGLRKATELGFDYAITIDSDGQHYPSDIPLLVEKIVGNPGNVVMGARNMDQEGIPGKSSFGNKFSNFWFWVETGIKLSDTQTGFRAYPLAHLKGMKFYTPKFEFEIEVIVRLAWRNIKFSEAKVRVEYPEDRVSHFRPFEDFSRISVLNTVLVTLALVFYLPRLLLWNFSFKDFWNRIKTEFLKDLSHPIKLASAVGLGLFFGILPIWGFQMLAAFSTASWLKLNRILVLLVSNISFPPLVPFIIFGSYKFGSLFVSQPVTLASFDEIDSETVYLQLQQYLIGATILAISLGVLGFASTWLIAKFFSKKS